ncbi:MAG: orotidine-5'-phosphate decarboxylase [Synergistaceae bacterium]|jgi:orotidine-5'-phosphate decarboxylase|nr:orotidine-5'-phosphate decarboxylase [Synergistaceae bacterium]
MSTLAIDRLTEAIERTGNPTALGLDTRIEYLPPSMLKDLGDIGSLENMEYLANMGNNPENDAVEEALFTFNRGLIDALADLVPCVKVQVAYYEMLGVTGMKLFRKTLLYAKEKGMIVIADVKRNDIGSTAEIYASAYLKGGSFSAGAGFPADFVTINAYFGVDGVAPFLSACEKNGTGIFVLVRTSNPSAGEFQDLIVRDAQGVKGGQGDERPLYEQVGLKVAQWGEALMGRCGYSSVGAVVGATWPEEGKRLRALLPRVFFLVPGYGVQGATARDLVGCFDGQGRGAIVNASRSLICAHKNRKTDDFASAARDEALRMRDDLRRAIAQNTRA